MNKSKDAFENGMQASPSFEGEGATLRKVGAKKILGMKKSHFFFYLSIVAFPILQFLVFYVYVNLNSFVLSFQKYDFGAGKFVWNGINNFKDIFLDFGRDESMRASVKNSLILFVLNLIFSNFGTIVFSYYIYKNHVGSKAFKVILYAPHIISTLIVVVMYKEFVEVVIPAIWLELFDKEIYPLLSMSELSKYITVLFFSIWVGLGTQVLVYSGTMSSISDSVIESAKLDGITPVKELFLIIIPLIWPTTITFLLSALAGIFTNQMHLFSFFGDNADPGLQTFGYLLYARVQKSVSMAEYPYLSALGLLMTCIAAPITLLVRRALEKYGPSTN